MRGRRSGIANLVGAVFFILIVVVMVGALSTTFGTFNGYLEGQHTANQTIQQGQQQSMEVQNLIFGGLTSYNGFSYNANGAVTMTANAKQHPILPISNMNFTGNMNGWTTSRSYSPVADSGTVENSPQNVSINSEGCPSPPSGAECFQLLVQNDNIPGSQFWIARISLLADVSLGVTTPQPVTFNWGPSPFLGSQPPSVVGDNITWVSAGLAASAIAPGASWNFTWSATLPAQTGTYYDTIVVSWINTLLPGTPFTDTAIATISTSVSPSPTIAGGTTTVGTSPTVLQDSPATWTANQWVGDLLVYTSGPAQGQSQPIIGNTANTVTTAAFSPAPNPAGGDIFAFVVSSRAGTSIVSISPAPNGAQASGVSAGYDANALKTTSESGPGSLYANFQPSFNSLPIVYGQQLTSTVNFTTSFYLDKSQASNLDTASCCTMTWASSLDGITAPRNSLVLYQTYLNTPPIPVFSGTTTAGTSPTVLQDTTAAWVPGQWIGDYLLYTSGPAMGEYQMITTNSPTTITTTAFNPAPSAGGGNTFIVTMLPRGLTYELPIGGTSCGPSPSPHDYVNPTLNNDFGTSGWVSGEVCFNPSTTIPSWLNAGAWYTGTYTLTIEVRVTLPGQSSLALGYPPQLSIHLDDIGLALKPLATTYYGSTTFQIPTGLNQNQVQGMELGVNMTGAAQNTTIYAYVADNSRFVYNPLLWVQIGSASTTNASAIDAVVPLPNAAYYVNSTLHTQTGKPEVGDVILRVNATSSAPLISPTVTLSVYVVIQTFNQTRAVVELKNLSPTPIRLLSMVITGPGAAISAGFASNFYFGPGEKIVLPEAFVWIPGQIYTVTVTTALGETFSGSFTAPLS